MKRETWNGKVMILECQSRRSVTALIRLVTQLRVSSIVRSRYFFRRNLVVGVRNSVLSARRLVPERLHGPAGDSPADAHDGLLRCEKFQWALSGGSSLVVRY